MKTNPSTPCRLTSLLAIGFFAVCSLLSARAGDPLFTSWLTGNSGLYARVVETNGGPLVTTWPSAALANMGGGQSLPAYSDIQQIRYSASYIYINGNGLASHQMGPWYNGVNVIFGNWPKNQNYIRRIPRVPQAATSNTVNGLGSIGLWVNGVSFFNLLDGFSYQNSTAQDVANSGDNIWVRNAVAVEVATFDKSNAHQPGNGEYHYHNNPTALRLQRNDNIAYDSTNAVYVENTASLHHSPILGWAYDGYPVYGPYGYSNATNSAAGVRRMVSGYVLRNGANGTTDLSSAGRHTLAAWSATLHGLSQTLTSGQYGPNVSTTFALGRYVEDFDFLGNLGGIQGSNYDLDIYNGRLCVTPEYPSGTYAYFVTINSDGSSAFPYTIGRQYYGVASGGAVTTITETVTNYFLGGTNTPTTFTSAKRATNGDMNLGWTSFEGAAFTLQVSTNLGATNWTSLGTNVTSTGLSSQFTESLASQGSATKRFYRAAVTGVASYDNGSGGTVTGTGNITSVSPASATLGSTVTVTITLNANATPPLPPAGVIPASVTIGTISGTSITRPNSTTVTAQFNPTSMNTSTGQKTVSVIFSSPGPTYTLANGFTVQ
ncbi:MAG: hypothetical protein JWR26_911 [Pedosphaera sp.]|nr:hypothetical protein [Pedosphaera sp.]